MSVRSWCAKRGWPGNPVEQKNGSSQTIIAVTTLGFILSSEK
jgi:hypothetical protein